MGRCFVDDALLSMCQREVSEQAERDNAPVPPCPRVGVLMEMCWQAGLPEQRVVIVLESLDNRATIVSFMMLPSWPRSVDQVAHSLGRMPDPQEQSPHQPRRRDVTPHFAAFDCNARECE
jgi:hypothetical protein